MVVLVTALFGLFTAIVAAALERVMNSIRNGLGMQETEIAREPS